MYTVFARVNMYLAKVFNYWYLFLDMFIFNCKIVLLKQIFISITYCFHCDRPVKLKWKNEETILCQMKIKYNIN